MVQELSNETFPLTFEITTLSNKVSLASVKEFTAEIGCLLMSEIMWKNLFESREDQEVSIKLIILETCTYAKLTPHSDDFLEIPDMRVMR